MSMEFAQRMIHQYTDKPVNIYARWYEILSFSTIETTK